MSHPLDLVDKLVLVFADAADGVFVHVLDSLDVLSVVLLVQVEQWKEKGQRHNVFAILGSLAHHQVDRYLLPILEALLDGQSDLGFDAIDARLVPALVRQDDARLLLDVAHRTRSVRNRDELRGPRLLLLHAEVQL